MTATTTQSPIARLAAAEQAMCESVRAVRNTVRQIGSELAREQVLLEQDVRAAMSRLQGHRDAVNDLIAGLVGVMLAHAGGVDADLAENDATPAGHPAGAEFEPSRHAAVERALLGVSANGHAPHPTPETTATPDEPGDPETPLIPLPPCDDQAVSGAGPAVRIAGCCDDPGCPCCHGSGIVELPHQCPDATPTPDAPSEPSRPGKKRRGRR